MTDPGDRVVPIRPDADNDDPWASGYAAGLRASGSTFIADDNVDPRVVVVRMLPDEYLDEAIAKAQLIGLKKRVTALAFRLDGLDDRYAGVKALAVRVTSLARRIARLENQATAPVPMAGDNIRLPRDDWRE